MVEWRAMVNSSQNAVFNEWMKLSPYLNVADRYKRFALPMSSPQSEEEDKAPLVFICRNALCGILDFGMEDRTRMKKSYDSMFG